MNARISSAFVVIHPRFLELIIIFHFLASLRYLGLPRIYFLLWQQSGVCAGRFFYTLAETRCTDVTPSQKYPGPWSSGHIYSKFGESRCESHQNPGINIYSKCASLSQDTKLSFRVFLRSLSQTQVCIHIVCLNRLSFSLIRHVSTAL